MGTKEILLCVLVGNFITVQSVIHSWDAAFPQDFPGFFDNFEPFPFKRQLDFTPYDPLFSSWRAQDPAFHMFPELPPLGTFNVPKVEVVCDESKLTVLVDKRSYGAALTEEEVHFGDGCFSNGELPHQFVFSYSLEECGTTHTVENGLDMFTNLLHLNLKNAPLTWWPTPSTIQIYCIPMRSHAPNPNVVSLTSPETKIFNINAMNPSWTGSAESNVYERGQIVNLQVSAKTRAQQQLFIQSCFVSGSPEHQAQPRHAVIMNKGCTAPLGFPHADVQFVASNRRDVVNFVLNTTYVISELYIHCRVFLSDQGITFGSKSCNYIAGQSRWEDVGGTERVCDCCKSKCKGLSVKYLPEDSKAIVSIGPLVIVDKDSELQETSTAPVTNILQSDGAVTEDRIVSDPPLTKNKFSFPPQDVVVVRQDPAARLTLWLPGQVQKEHISSQSEDSLIELQADNLVPNNLPVQEFLFTDQDSPLNLAPNERGLHNWNVLTLVDGWVLPPLEKAATTEGSGRKTRSGRSGLFGVKAPQEVDTHVPDEQTANDFNRITDELTKVPAETAVMSLEGTNTDGPVLRSKLQFSQGLDGSRILSYEEELKQQGKGVFRKFGMSGFKRQQELKKKRLHTSFLDLLRRMDKAE